MASDAPMPMSQLQVRAAGGRAGRSAIPRRLVAGLLIALAGVGFLFPLWWMIVNSLRPGSSILNSPLGFDPGDFSLRNWRAMFENVPIIRALGNTAVVVGVKARSR